MFIILIIMTSGRVKKYAVTIFSLTVFFLSSVTNQSNIIDIKPIAVDVRKDSYVLMHVSKI